MKKKQHLVAGFINDKIYEYFQENRVNISKTITAMLTAVWEYDCATDLMKNNIKRKAK